MESLPAVSPKVVDLAVADLTIYAAFILPSLVITWVHGKTGMVAWPILISYIAMRFLGDGYLIAHRTEPEIPNAVAILSNAGATACITLLIMGVIYEANIILPFKRRWSDKIFLAAANLINTAGIGIATYGGSPNEKTRTLNSRALDKTGWILQILVMIILIAWLGVTWPRTQAAFPSRSQRPALWLFWSAVASIPFQLVHIIGNTALAFNGTKALDPIMGAFSTKLWLVFFMHLAAFLALGIGGWMSIPRGSDRSQYSSNNRSQSQEGLEVERTNTDETDIIPLHPGFSITNFTSFPKMRS
ncbi:uncharacterized protein J3D65DRAFT_640377 [Phyllosticta citribraziliensis]|uniref:DUF7702 domain-containing protein n=1 Tax=Phyllosticta citribraziliensis TaxID=989973 RepID=A0ABR1L4J5_9PEZI